VKKLKFLETSFLFPARGIFFMGMELDFDFEKRANGWEYLESHFNISRKSVLLPFQEHTSRIIFEEESLRPSDGIFTSSKCAGVLTADCVPVLIRAGNKAVGAIHGGWRGLKEEIVRKAIRLACENYRVEPQEISASIGPSAGVCCYEVKEDVLSIFVDKGYGMFFERRNGKLYLDLKMVAKSQLEKEGVNKIEVVDICTICNKDFHSYRRGSKGKMLSVIFFRGM
jgi:YfiH family protein